MRKLDEIRVGHDVVDLVARQFVEQFHAVRCRDFIPSQSRFLQDLRPELFCAAGAGENDHALANQIADIFGTPVIGVVRKHCVHGQIRGSEDEILAAFFGCNQVRGGQMGEVMAQGRQNFAEMRSLD